MKAYTSHSGWTEETVLVSVPEACSVQGDLFTLYSPWNYWLIHWTVSWVLSVDLSQLKMRGIVKQVIRAPSYKKSGLPISVPERVAAEKRGRSVPLIPKSQTGAVLGENWLPEESATTPLPSLIQSVDTLSGKGCKCIVLVETVLTFSIHSILFSLVRLELGVCDCFEWE